MKNSKIILTCLIFLSCCGFLFLSCQGDKIPEIEIIAQVETEYLTRTELDHWLPQDVTDEQRRVMARQYVDRWVNATALYLASKQQKIELDAHTNWLMDFQKKEVLAEKLIQGIENKRMLITDEELSRYYENHQKEYEREKDEVHLVQLYLEKLDKAIVKEIRASEFLLDVIEKNYLNTLGNRMYEQNGDLGYVVVENLRSPIRRRVKSGRTGRIYGPIKIDQGNLYFQMLDKKDAKTIRDFENVKDDIWLKLSAIKRMQEVEKFTEKTVKNYKVKIYPEHIR